MAYCSECTYLDLSSEDLYGKFWYLILYTLLKNHFPYIVP